MNFGSSQEQDETAIELTSLIDVVFLLLIFFMISTTFTKETSLKINLPESNGEVTTEQPQSVEVQVSSSAEYAISNSTDGVAQPLINSNRETLKRALLKYKDQKALLLIIRADKNATHDAVIRVLDVAKQIGLTNITFATKQTAE